MRKFFRIYGLGRGRLECGGEENCSKDRNVVVRWMCGVIYNFCRERWWASNNPSTVWTAVFNIKGHRRGEEMLYRWWAGFFYFSLDVYYYYYIGWQADLFSFCIDRIGQHTQERRVLVLHMWIMHVVRLLLLRKEIHYIVFNFKIIRLLWWCLVIIIAQVIREWLRKAICKGK